MNGVFPIGNTESEYKNKRLRLSLGIKTFCPPTADGGAKAGFKVQRLSQGSGTFCKQSLHLGILLGSKRVKVRKGTTALLAKPQFSLSYNLSLSWQALIGASFHFLAPKKRKTLVLSKSVWQFF